MSDPTLNLHAVGESYRSGAYFEDPRRHADDAALKVQVFRSIFERLPNATVGRITRYADVGCGSGEVAVQTARVLREAGQPLGLAQAYDVSPHVAQLRLEGVEPRHADFTTEAGTFDLVTVFDVAEHVPNPAAFLGKIAAKARLVAVHLPLEDHLNWNLRGRHRARLKDPGHLLVLDFASALNLVTCAGLQVLDYAYTPGFEAPSGRASRLAQLLTPARRLLANKSPWLLSKTLGGMSLMVLARGQLGE